MTPSDNSDNFGSPRLRFLILLGSGAMVLLIATFIMAGAIRGWQKTHTEIPPSEITALALSNHRIDRATEARNRGQKVFQHYCAICHGQEGKGDGFNATTLEATMKVKPRDFTSPQFQQQMTDESLYAAIAEGGTSVGKSNLMPAWHKTLGEKKIRDTIAYLKSIQPVVTKPAATE